MTRYSCDVIQDLLPLYEDGCCSEESKALVEAHLAECSQCRQARQEMQLPFSAHPLLEDISAEQVLKNGMRKVRRFLRRSLTIAAAIMIACVALFLVWQLGSGIFHRSYEIDYQSKCYFWDDSSGTLTLTGESTFSIVGRGSSKRFSNEMGKFQGHIEIAAYPIPLAETFREFSCSVDDDLVQISNHGVQLTKPDATYWYWVFISPEDPDVCIIHIYNIPENTVTHAVCGDTEEEARENYQKYLDAFHAMVKSDK